MTVTDSDNASLDKREAFVRSEFACVRISVSKFGKSERLTITDMRTGSFVILDALELESLAWCFHEDLSRLLNPAKTRWLGSGP